MKILIADDDRVSQRLLQRMLTTWGYDVVVCSDGNEAYRHLLEKTINLAILDWEMPGMNGIQICKAIRTSVNANAYLILLSATGAREDVISGLEAGADDFIRKPFDSGELRARLQTGRRIIELEQSLREQTIRDPLTGLFNRRYMQETFERELSRAARNGSQVGILVMDIDHFKRINDTHGHKGGDAVLTAVSRFLREQTRAGDVVCRFGGEEFVLILPGISSEAVWTKADELRKGIAVCAIPYNGSEIGPIRISTGISVFPHHGVAAEELFRAADAALYEAKNNGRDQVRLYVPEKPLVNA